MTTVHMGWKREDEASQAQSLVLLWPAGGAKESSQPHLCRDLHLPLRKPMTENWDASCEMPQAGQELPRGIFNKQTNK